jgi:hypothetical protein
MRVVGGGGGGVARMVTLFHELTQGRSWCASCVFLVGGGCFTRESTMCCSGGRNAERAFRVVCLPSLVSGKLRARVCVCCVPSLGRSRWIEAAVATKC